MPSPRVARALLHWLLPRAEREFVIGDLEESFASRLADGDVRGARRWYWRSAISAIAALRAQRGIDRNVIDPVYRGDGTMKNLLRDARYGLRLLLQKPAFTAVAVVTLALGIGANTAIFTVTYALLIKPLPYQQPDQLTIVTENNISRGWPSFSVSPANFLDWRAQNRSFSAIAAYGARSLNYSGSGTPERLRGLSGTEGFLEMLGGTPQIGRGFQPEEFTPGKESVVILAHGFWQRAYGGRPDVLNRTIALNGQPYTIVGVMHPDWRFGGRDISVFLPRAFSADERAARGGHFLNVVARRNADVALDQARTDMTNLAARLADQYPDTNKGWGANVTSLQEAAVGNVRPMILILVGAVGLVLLVACANLANMHMARATVRAREIAIRTAIGAGRGRIVQQLLTESLILAIAGGGLGLLVAYWATTSFIAAYPTLLPRSADIHVDFGTLVYTGGLSLLTAMLFGLSPAIAASRPDLQDALRDGGRGGTSPLKRWMRNGLVVGEIALALVLLTGAGLLIRSFVLLARVDPGFATDHRATVTTLLPRPKYAEPARMIDFYDRAQERLRSIPGVQAVALTSTVPISGNDEIYSIEFEGRPPLPPGQGVSAIYYLVSSGYFQTMGIPVLKGRGFTDADREGAPRVAIINDTFARLHYPNENPIGRRIRMGRNGSIVREIVGVVGSVKHYGLTDKEHAQMYEPFRQMPTTGMAFVLETTVEPTSVVPAVRKEIQQIDPDQPVVLPASLDSLLADSTALPRVQTLLLGAFATIALLLAGVGLYGVTAYGVSQRTQEIGIRMTLGARRQSVLLMVLRQALALTALGLAIGLAGALALGRVLEAALKPLLYNVEPADITTLVAVSMILAVVTVLASLIPARRATKVDPIQALRSL